MIDLAPDENACAKLVGSRRTHSSAIAGSPRRFGPRDQASEEQDQHAAGAEIAVCKHLGGWWEAISDIGHNAAKADMRLGNKPFQIRWSQYGEAFLPIYLEDPDDQEIYFVVGKLPSYRIIGKVPIGAVKQEHYWRTTNPKTKEPLQHPCFVIPQNDFAWALL